MEKYLHVEVKHKHINTSINLLKKIPKLQKTLNVYLHINTLSKLVT